MFVLTFFFHGGKRFDKKINFNLKSDDVATRLTNNYNTHIHRVHWGIKPPLKTPLPSFLQSPFLKSENSPSSPFLGNLPPIYWFRSYKVAFFSEPTKCYSFSSLIPSYLLKVKFPSLNS